MKLDYTIRGIIVEIRNELKEDSDIDMSEQEIFEIADSQFVAGALARLKKISVTFAYIGSLLYKDLHYIKNSLIESKKAAEEMTDKERKAFITKNKIFHKKNFTASKMKRIKSLKELPSDAHEGKSFEHYRNVFKDIVNKK